MFILQVLYSVISDLVAVQGCLSAYSSDPQGVPSPRQPSALPQLTGKDPLSAEQPGRGCKEPVVCVRAYVKMTSETPLCFDTLNVHWRQNFPQFGSGPRYLLSSHQQRTKLHIGVCQRVRTLFTLHCRRLSIGHIPARVSGQCRR